MEQFIENILIGVREWVNGTLDEITYVISSHINELRTRIITAETNIDNKVDKVQGKGLSTNDLTDALKEGYDDAVTKKHEHSNKAVLDGITAQNVTDWSAAEANVLESISAGDASVTIGTLSGKNQTVAVKIDSTTGNALQLVEGQGLRVEIPAATVTGVKSTENIIGLDGTELTSTLTIDMVDGTGDDAGKKFIRLLGKNSNPFATVDVSSLVTDGMLEAAGFYRYHAVVVNPSTPAYWELVSGDDIAGHGSASEATTWTQTAVDGQEYIVLKWNTAASSKMTFIDAAGLVDDYSQGTGITIQNRTISLNIAGTTAATIGGVYVEANSGLTLANDGKLSINGPSSWEEVYNFLNTAETPAASEGAAGE